MIGISGGCGGKSVVGVDCGCRQSLQVPRRQSCKYLAYGFNKINRLAVGIEINLVLV